MKPDSNGWIIDERESHVMGNAARWALNVNYGMGLVASVIVLAFGWVAFFLLVLVATLVPHLLFTYRSKKDGVDIYAVAGRQGDRIWRRSVILLCIFVLVMSAVALIMSVTGEPLVPGILSAEITDIMGSFLKGFAVGGLVGGAVGLVAVTVSSKKAARAEEAEDDE